LSLSFVELSKPETPDRRDVQDFRHAPRNRKDVKHQG
jgi:hypothetical protein